MAFQDGFTTGTDATVDLYDPQDGSLTRVAGLTNFSAKPRTKDLEHHGNDGVDRFGKLYLGWDVSFEYDREDGVLDRYFAAREARQRSGVAQGTITITQTIQERNGSITQFRFTRVELQQDDPGSFQREEKTSGKVSGMAGLRELVG